MRSWNDIQKATNSDIVVWAERQPWAEPMRRCPQDAQWHAEGDVWTHTLMVCREVERVEGYSELGRETQLKLLFTALLHDAGKPASTVIDCETGRTRSPKHSLIGAAMTRHILRDLGCSLDDREQIVNLVRYHGRPPYLLEQNEPEQEVIRLSCLLSNQLLYLFALADTRGRTTTEMTRPEDSLRLWRDLSLEHGCFSSAYPFANDHARFLLFRGELSNLHYTPHEKYRCTVTLMSGLPGAGKDTWLKHNQPELSVVSLDTIREELDVSSSDNQGQVVQAAREQCRKHLRAGRDFAFNATNITTLMRRRWIDLFADYEARIRIIYLEPTLSTLLRQNKDRPDAVPESVIHRLLEKIEVPTLGEAHEVFMG